MHNSGSWLTENASKFKSENEHFTVSRLNADQIAALRLFCFRGETKKITNNHYYFFSASRTHKWVNRIAS